MLSRRTLACQYGSREEFAIMLARQSKPMEMSEPACVFKPLWHATQRSDVWNSGFTSDCSAPPRNSVGNAASSPKTRMQYPALEKNALFCITSPQLAFHLPSPRERRTTPGSDVPRCCSPVCALRCWREHAADG